MATIDQVTLISVKDMGNDVLFVEGTIDGIVDVVSQKNDKGKLVEAKVPRRLVAQGWMSAMTNHYDANQYEKDGHLVESAEPHEMTKEEKQVYCKQLLLDQNPQPQELDIL